MSMLALQRGAFVHLRSKQMSSRSRRPAFANASSTADQALGANDPLPR